MSRLTLYLGIVLLMACLCLQRVYSGQQQPNPQSMLITNQLLFTKRMVMPKGDKKDSEPFPQLEPFNKWAVKQVEKPPTLLLTNQVDSRSVAREHWQQRGTNLPPVLPK